MSSKNQSGSVDVTGFNAVMQFIAKTSGDKASTLWLELAQAAAKDHGFDTPQPSMWMDCKWLFNKLHAVSLEAQWDLVSRAEPLFHSAWEASTRATDMLECASLLYPPRQENPRIVNDDVRLAACDIAETSLQYNKSWLLQDNIILARKYAFREIDKIKTTWKKSGAKWDGLPSPLSSVIDIVYAITAPDSVSLAASATSSAIANDSFTDGLWEANYILSNARNAAVVRRALGTPGLMLLMR